MKVRRSILAPVLMGMSLSSISQADVMEVMVGEIQFVGMDFPCIYNGDYEHLISETVDQGQQPTTAVEFDLSAFIMEIDFGRIAWIRVTGPSHETSQIHPGADIDMFMIDGISEGIDVQYHYDGPNPMYDGVTSDFLASSVAAVDVQYGQSPTDGSFLSLGTSGSIVMTFNETHDDGGNPGEDESDGNDDGGNDGEAEEGDGSDQQDDQDPGNDSGGNWPPFDIDPNNPALMDVGGRIWMEGLDTSPMQSGLLGDSLVLRLNEIAPISELISVYIGFEESLMVVPGPAGGMMALGVAAFRRSRRR